jgi:hypothetical protein
LQSAQQRLDPSGAVYNRDGVPMSRALRLFSSEPVRVTRSPAHFRYVSSSHKTGDLDRVIPA